MRLVRLQKSANIVSIMAVGVYKKIAFRWRKASDPNHLSVYAYLQEYYDDLIGTWRTTQENRTTTILYGSSLG